MIKARGGKPVAEPYEYHWRSMPVGVKKVCPSPIDAVIEVIMHELRLQSQLVLLTELGINHGSISRCRHRRLPIQHEWLLRASIFSGIPYIDLCALASEDPQYHPHPNAWRAK
jgi:hypothetical protein